MTLHRAEHEGISVFQRDVLKKIRQSRQRGLTDVEIAQELQLGSPQKVREAREELESAGYVRELGVTRAIKGKMSPVYVSTVTGNKVEV